MIVSFIIRFKNEEEHIQRCVENILEQNGDFTRELIFVNDASTDKSIKYVQSLLKSPPKNSTVKLINIAPGKFTYSSALNVAIPEVTGEYFVTITVHVELYGKNAVLNMIKNFDDPNVVGVTARTLPFNPENTFSKLSLATSNVAYKITRSNKFFTFPEDKLKLSNYLFSCVFSCIRTNIFRDKTNWFREVPRAEDLDWAYRMINKGYTIIYDPLVIILHHNNDNANQIASRWVNANVALNLTLTSKVLSRYKIFRNSMFSITTFMWSVIFREKKFFKKFYYLGKLFVVYFYITKAVTFDFGKISKWEKMFNSFPDSP
jgi:glycosyltransferase involved in cell wall biosynthesis